MKTELEIKGYKKWLEHKLLQRKQSEREELIQTTKKERITNDDN